MAFPGGTSIKVYGPAKISFDELKNHFFKISIFSSQYDFSGQSVFSYTLAVGCNHLLLTEQTILFFQRFDGKILTGRRS